MIKILEKFMQYLLVIAVAALFVSGCSKKTPTFSEKIVQGLQSSSLSFSDTDQVEGTVTGKVVLDSSAEVNNQVAKWVIYWSDAASVRGKSTKACESDKGDIVGGTVCELSSVKVNGKYFLAYAADAKGGEFYTNKSVAVVDVKPKKEEPKKEEPKKEEPVAATDEPVVATDEPVVATKEPVVAEKVEDPTAKIFYMLENASLAFLDNDNKEIRVTGNIKLYADEELEKLVPSWVVYWSDGEDASGKTIKVCEVRGIVDGVICKLTDEVLIGDHFLAYAVDEEGNEYPETLSVEVVDAFVEISEPIVAADVPVDVPVVVTDVPVVATEEPIVATEEPVVATEEPIEVDEPSAPTPITILLDNVLYEFDKAALQDEYMTYLDDTFENAADKASMTFVIAGHADERGSNEYNLALGERRAYAVKRYLISLGFYEENVRIISYGEEKPMDSGHNESAWSKNRRSVTELTQ
jgi:peptidoglycan-associated lipoprotein